MYVESVHVVVESHAVFAARSERWCIQPAHNKIKYYIAGASIRVWGAIASSRVSDTDSRSSARVITCFKTKCFESIRMRKCPDVCRVLRAERLQILLNGGKVEATTTKKTKTILDRIGVGIYGDGSGGVQQSGM